MTEPELRMAITIMPAIKLGVCIHGDFSIYVPTMTRCPLCAAWDEGIRTGEWVSP